MQIIPAQAAHFTDWNTLWQGYLEFYGTTLTDEMTALTWQRFLDPLEPMHCFLAFDDAGKMVGFVTSVVHRSTWSNTGYCYLEDLYVGAAARGLGAGRALIDAVKSRAMELGAERLYWEAQEENTKARKLYDALATNAGFVQYRMALK